MEPRGSLLIPPDFNVSVTDWERSLRLRDGQFAVLESEPERCASAPASASGSAAECGSGAATATITTTTTTTTVTTTTTTTTATTTSAAGAAAAQQQQQQSQAGGGPAAGAGPFTAPASSTLARYSGLSGSDLENIRARLETLLPADD
ncbi:hypothetical protein TSOC_001620 [Tetrabaena socialis]|uniref:Uncharacterized protein n=1 Tax=Tetrabaena socialis TaxID=47790 RepID=A0A2J8AG57_9CHLO|nr:hypothetical protein TSOC_001620 [Tetrabaena socialis]|eukprot:PNH11504.1 hypothetical protein TSOC_001620 [Tetrabaena socialis]